MERGNLGIPLDTTGQKTNKATKQSRQRGIVEYAEILTKQKVKKAYFTPHSYLLCPYFLRSTSDPIRPCFVGLVSDLSRRRVGGGAIKT